MGLGLQAQSAAAVARHVEELQAPGLDRQPRRFLAPPPGHRDRRWKAPSLRGVQGGLAVVESRMAAPTGAADVELRRPAGHQVGEALAGGGLDVVAADPGGLHQAQQHPFPQQIDEAADEEVGRPARGESGDAPAQPHGARLTQKDPHKPVVLVGRLLHQVLGQVRQPLVEPGRLADSLPHEDVLVEADQMLELVGQQGPVGLLGNDRIRPEQIGHVAVSTPGPGHQRGGAELAAGAAVLHQVGDEDRDPAVSIHVRRGPEGLHHNRVVLGELIDDPLHPIFVDVVVVFPQVVLDPGHDEIVDGRHPRLERLPRDPAIAGEAKDAAVPDLVLHRRRLARPAPLLLHPQGQGPFDLPGQVVDGIAAVGPRRNGRLGQGGGAVQGDRVHLRPIDALNGRRVEGEDKVLLLEIEAGLDAPRGVGPQVHEVGDRFPDLQSGEGDRHPGPEGIVADKGQQALVSPRAAVAQHDFPGLAGTQLGRMVLHVEWPFHLGRSELDGGVPPVEQGDPALPAGQQGHGQHPHLQLRDGRIDALDDDVTNPGPDRVILQLRHRGQAGRQRLIEMHEGEVAPRQQHRSPAPLDQQATVTSQNREGIRPPVGLHHQVVGPGPGMGKDDFPGQTAVHGPGPETQLDATGPPDGVASQEREPQGGDAVLLHAPRQGQGLTRLEGGGNGLVQNDAGEVVPRYFVRLCQEGIEQQEGHREGRTHGLSGGPQRSGPPSERSSKALASAERGPGSSIRACRMASATSVSISLPRCAAESTAA